MARPTRLYSHAFRPKTELTLFAAQFANNYLKIHKAGHFFSDCGEWHIFYRVAGTEEWVFRITAANTIEINYSRLRANATINENTVFFIVLWCAAFVHYKKNFGKIIFEEADKWAVWYYVGTGRPPADIMAYLALLQVQLNDDHIDNIRYRKMRALLYDHLKPSERPALAINADHEQVLITISPWLLLKKPHDQLLNKELLPYQITLAHIDCNTRKRIARVWLPKGYKIQLKFDGGFYQLDL